jgi:tetratricopeptide (TPR) repeat protein
MALAQGGVGSTRGLPGSSGGIHTIQGRIVFPPGHPATQLRVKLEGNVTGSNSTSSNDDGTFSFPSLSAGNYTVIIDAGPDYEPVRENVTIYGTSAYEGRVAPQTIFVPITLRLKGSGGSASALDKVPKPARDLYTKGMEEAAKGDSKKAVEHLSGAVAAYPEFPQALTELGVQYLKLGQADKAAETLQSALKLTPDDVSARLDYGIALLNQKKYTEAETQLRQVLTKNSAIPTAHMYLGIALLSLSRDEKTKQYNMAKYTEAQKELEVAVSTGKDEVAMAHRYLGGIYAGNRDYKRGADELETYLKLVPKAADAERIKAAIKDLRSRQ